MDLRKEHLRKVRDELMALERRRTPDEPFDPEVVTTEIEQDRSAAPEIAATLEWDDALGAHRYRVEQVGRLMRAVTVLEIVRGEPVETPQRALYAVRVDRDSEGAHGWRWRPVEVVQKSPDDLADVLEQYEADIRGNVFAYAKLTRSADRVRKLLLTIAEEVDAKYDQ